jgi:DNA-binding MarR family transcriptional regulator
MDLSKNELLERLFRLEWLLRMKHMHHHRDHGPMATPHRGQGRILALLALKPEMSQKELAAILDIRSQSLGELLAKLERQGFITRSTSEEDRRGMNISLTDAGRTAAEQPDDSDFESFFDCLNEEEQTAFAGYLERLIEKLEAQLGPDREGRGFPPHFGPHGMPGFGGRGPFRPGHGHGHGRGPGEF